MSKKQTVCAQTTKSQFFNLTLASKLLKMLSLVLYAFTRSPFDKVSSHAMDMLSSRDREQSKKMCLSQHILDLMMLKQQTDQNFFLLQ